jgi:hypothetical protein
VYPTYAKANIAGLWVDWWYSVIYFDVDGEITYFELKIWAPYQYYYYGVQHAPPSLPGWSIGATAITYLGRISSDTIDAYAWTVDFRGACPV